MDTPFVKDIDPEEMESVVIETSKKGSLQPLRVIKNRQRRESG